MLLKTNLILILPLVLLSCPASLSVAQDAESNQEIAAPENLDIYLLIGQSNMAGRAPYSEANASPIERCFLFEDDSKWVPARNPLNQFSTIRKNLGMQKLNPGFMFAKTMLAKQQGVQIGLVVNAKGGTRIEQWEKGAKFYDEAVMRAQLASKQGTIKGVLWHQGEGNASEPENYLQKLKKLVVDLRTDLNSPRLLFVAGQIAGDEAINREIAKLPDELVFTAVASSKGLTTFDRWHFDTPSMKLLGERYAHAMLRLQAPPVDPFAPEVDALATRKNLEVAGHQGFVMLPQNLPAEKVIPWVWYAPTLGKNLPGPAEKWMFDRLHKAGIAIAGIDVGESFGSPKGRKTYQQFYEYLTTTMNFGPKPVLLARSRGGLMLYSWATAHPESVGGIAGIYPVCNIASYPGLERAASAYEMTPEQLGKHLAEFNPIDRLDGLIEHRVPIFHIHGDSDNVVPLEANSAQVESIYRNAKVEIEVEVVQGQGHNMWEGWFTSSNLLRFVIHHAKL